MSKSSLNAWFVSVLLRSTSFHAWKDMMSARVTKLIATLSVSALNNVCGSHLPTLGFCRVRNKSDRLDHIQVLNFLFRCCFEFDLQLRLTFVPIVEPDVLKVVFEDIAIPEDPKTKFVCSLFVHVFHEFTHAT